ncbi:MAG: branched-chain amino acid ABC transporter permease, partial [Betaproteobacteria bacterium]|nr:branched-chain amino acid ABC transporter permease [Betaproteobacteria bacterium]
AHASFYMLGAFFAFTIAKLIGFWPALILAPVLVGLIGAGFERYFLRKVHALGHVPELLITFGLAFLLLELVQLIWGRTSVDYRIPPELDGPLFTVYGTQFPIYKAFMMMMALLMLASVGWLIKRTRIGLVIQAALTHPETVEALGHNVPRVFMLVFGGGAALAGLAGVIGGNAFVTEPGMAAAVGPVIFVVVVVGGLGSLAGAFLASLLIGIVQTFSVGIDASLLSALASMNMVLTPDTFGYQVLSLKVSQIAPIMPFLFLVLILIFRPKGLMGKREG